MAEEETKDTEVDENSDDQNTEGEAPKALADESGKINSDVLQSIPVTISVEVGKTSLKIRDLLRLTQGSVVGGRAPVCCVDPMPPKKTSRDWNIMSGSITTSE